MRTFSAIAKSLMCLISVWLYYIKLYYIGCPKTCIYTLKLRAQWMFFFLFRYNPLELIIIQNVYPSYWDTVHITLQSRCMYLFSEWCKLWLPIYLNANTIISWRWPMEIKDAFVVAVVNGLFHFNHKCWHGKQIV